MIYFIIGLVIFLAIIFMRDKSDEVAKIHNQGGMKAKYKTLITSFANHPNARIYQDSSSSIRVSVMDRFVLTEYTINHGFSDFTVFWYHESATYGKHKLRWTFPEHIHQVLAADTIFNEVDEYSIHLVTKTF